MAILDIDDRSRGAIGQWPWSRDVVARLVTRLRDLGASVVALDIIFLESDRFDRVDADRPASPAVVEVDLTDVIWCDETGRVPFRTFGLPCPAVR